MRRITCITVAALLLTSLLSACATPDSAVDQAYSAGGVFSTAPYTRSIFSSSQF